MHTTAGDDLHGVDFRYKVTRVSPSTATPSLLRLGLDRCGLLVVAKLGFVSARICTRADCLLEMRWAVVSLEGVEVDV